MSISSNFPLSDGFTSSFLDDGLFSDAAKLLALLYDNTDEYFILADTDLRIRLYNKRTYKEVKNHMGIELKPGLNILTLSDLQRREMLVNVYNNVLQGKVEETEVSLTSLGGAQLHLHNIIRPVKDDEGKIIGVIVSSKDITEKKLAEEQLRESEQKYRLIFETNPLPCFIYDIDTFNIRKANSRALSYYGYTLDEIKKLKVFDLWPEEVRSRQYDIIQSVLYSTFNTRSWKHRAKDGKIFEVEINSEFIVLDSKPARMVMVKDISNQLMAEQALNESNERFKLATKATSDAIYDWNLSTNILTWGEGLETLFGYQSSEISISEWEKLIHPEDRAEIIASLHQALSDPSMGIWKREYRFMKKDGSFRDVLESGYIRRNEEGTAQRMIGAVQDITEQKEKERELIQSNERFDIVIKATNDLIWDWNLETGAFYRDSEGIRKVYGVHDEESISDIHFWLQRVHPDDKENLKNVLDEILNNPTKESFEAEYRFMKDDGEYVYIYDRGILIRDEQFKPIRMIGAAQDITERKKLEIQLLKRELNKQKLISRATIETQERERGEIGKELHDNVNQILTTTKLYLELAATNQELKDELIKKSSQNIITVINEIRQLSRSLMNPSLGDLGLIDAINDLIETITITRKLAITFTAEKNIEDVLNENQKLMIFRITQEALNNALRHSKATQFCICLKENDGNVDFLLQDNGAGFDLENVKKGAGLKNIQNRVYLANGTLTITTAPDKGCSISINFPTKTTSD